MISGGGGSDYLSGGSGNDQISGDSGHDKLRGGSGNDVLKGGTGNNLLNGEYGTDTASYAASNVGVLAFTNSHTGSGNGSSIRTDGHDTLLSIENLQGSRFADVLVGGNGANVLQGMNGVDEMEGRGGNDRLDGGRGDDKLWGGSGYDTMTGGDGADTFVFLNNDALDRITDFSVEDVIQLSFHAVGTQWSRQEMSEKTQPTHRMAIWSFTLEMMRLCWKTLPIQLVF